jgi:hypothetical protein
MGLDFLASRDIIYRDIIYSTILLSLYGDIKIGKALA